MVLSSGMWYNPRMIREDTRAIREMLRMMGTVDWDLFLAYCPLTRRERGIAYTAKSARLPQPPSFPAGSSSRVSCPGSPCFRIFSHPNSCLNSSSDSSFVRGFPPPSHPVPSFRILSSASRSMSIPCPLSPPVLTVYPPEGQSLRRRWFDITTVFRLRVCLLQCSW